jgi:DNA-binding CsgD family transcriptional regulator
VTGRRYGPPEPRVGTRGLAERELRSRVAAVLAARRGPGLVALVEGPPGIGETHPLDRLASDAGVARMLTRGLTRGDGAAARHAAQTLEEVGFALAAAYAWEECACLDAAAGDRERAVTAMERAVSAYEAIGACTDRGRLLARLRALGVRRGPRSKHTAATSGWAALTPTERQVADLVRRGLTNREIAAHLFVSPRTVQSHVSHILAKLDLRSRVEIAARHADVAPA